LTNPGELSFYYIVSSESCCDNLFVLIDNNQQQLPNSMTWTSKVIALSQGEHTVRFTYNKDGSVSSGDDAAYLDDIFITGLGGSCEDSDPCTADGLADDGETCVYCPLGDGVACAGDNECLTNYACSQGECVGEPLEDETPCMADDNACTFDYCVSGQCTHPNFDDGISCEGAIDTECSTSICQAGICMIDKQNDCTPCEEGNKACISGVCGGYPGNVELSFEDGLVPDVLIMSGDAPWQNSDSVAAEGLHSLASGAISDNETSSFLLEVDIASAGELRFNYKVSSEFDYDYLKVFVDNESRGQWSGNVDWTPAVFSLSPGVHQILFSYEKDSSEFSGSDQAWIDNLVVTGLEVSCDSADPCSWDGMGADGCVSCPKPDDTACDDGLFCTISSACQSGECTPVEQRDCQIELSAPDCQTATCNDDTDECVVEAVNEGLDCDDGRFCTTASACSNGACLGTQQRDCSSAVTEAACQLPRCDEDNDTCYAIPANENAVCAADDWCRNTSRCAQGVCVGNQRDCSGSVPNPQCQEAACDPDAQICYAVSANESGSCDDGKFCTINDTCTSGVCTGETYDCADVIDAPGCQSAICNELADTCDLQPINEGETCEDNLFCTMQTTCATGACTGGPQRDCSAAVTEPQCQAPACNEVTDICEANAANNMQSCDDNAACTIDDICMNGQCVGQEISCADEVACTVDRCDEELGCIHEPDDSLCDDDNPHTTDTCNATLGCAYEEAGACETPIEVASNTYSDNNTLMARSSHVSNYAGDCGSYEGSLGDVVYHIAPTDCACGCTQMRATLDPDGYDAVLVLMSDCTNAASCIEVANDHADTNAEELVFSAQAYLIVERVGVLNNGGDYTLEIVEICEDGDADSDAVDGDTTDGDAPDGDVVDGDTPDGDTTDGDTTDGDVPDGDAVDGDIPDGDTPDGDLSDGDAPDGDIPDGDATDGDIIDGGVGGGSGSGCASSDPTAGYLLLAALALLAMRRRRA
jgi:MYXO-CTERM domain-containing protein